MTSWERVESNWVQYRFSAMEWFGLTSEEAAQVAGRRVALRDLVAKLHICSEAEADTRIEAWQKHLGRLLDSSARISIAETRNMPLDAAQAAEVYARMTAACAEWEAIRKRIEEEAHTRAPLCNRHSSTKRINDIVLDGDVALVHYGLLQDETSRYFSEKPLRIPLSEVGQGAVYVFLVTRDDLDNAAPGSWLTGTKTGAYWQSVTRGGFPKSAPQGPYGSLEEAEAEARKAYPNVRILRTVPG